ncbi:hypothetical protein GCM10010193_70400 [Kitasatospora atroaurantiaca]|uniref:Uncharacterized protein n=1 Tax=Kitasatospora atroaurantiaca TaxID=285545 RepID=A0A561END4_9ACTN|nr:hypothetical protein [Kitasatospora atroaurantiaca]TWE17125.1 hypothetical protein FB465_2130 [Kitasatospora atroaurantiaca]
MADLCFNVALGRLAYYASLPAANDALIAIPYAASGLPSDATLRDCATVAAIASAGATEQTTLGRKTLSSVTVTVNNTNDRVELDAADLSWTATAGAAIAAVVICYDPDSTGGVDADLVPLTKHDVTMTPDGTNLSLTISDFCRITSAA